MSNELKRNAIGTAGIVFFVVAAAAPLAATLGASPLVFGATGVGAPARICRRWWCCCCSPSATRR
jgi:hypothetical protein